MNPPPAEGLASRLFLGPALRTQPDRRLVTLVRDGYDTAFEEIVRRYGKALTRYAAAIVGGRSEDVTQDAFSKALLALRRDSRRRDRPQAVALPDRPQHRPQRPARPAAGGRRADRGARRRLAVAAEEAERREEVAELMQRLRDLPEPQRAAIVMRELEGLGHEEIAAALGLSGGGARQAIYRARQALRDGLGLLIPLPLLRVLIEHGADATARPPRQAPAAPRRRSAAAGAGTALKVGVVTAVLAGSVGTGLAIKEEPRAATARRRGRGRGDASAAADEAPERRPSAAEPDIDPRGRRLEGGRRTGGRGPRLRRRDGSRGEVAQGDD